MIPFKLQKRLLTELNGVTEFFPQFKLFQASGQIYFLGWYITTKGPKYLLKLLVSNNYPDERPRLYVISPKLLRTYNGSFTLNNSAGCSHNYHTLSNDLRGNLQICHYSSESWHAGCTCVEVIKKGQIWCEAHVEHLSTGRSIAEIINNWKKSKKNEQDRKDLNWGELLKLKPYHIDHVPDDKVLAFLLEDLSRNRYVSISG